jgi:thiamine biosynthesis lipoprotein
MGSACELVLCAPDQAQAMAWAQSAAQEIVRIEAKYSRYKPDSVVGMINAQAGREWTPCDEETRALLDFADHLFKSSEGLFDITSGTLRKVWDFQAGTIPSSETLAAQCANVGWEKLQRQEKQVRLAQVGMEIDFGGFGKEYAADRAATLLASLGVQHGYVNLAGDMRIIGPKPDGAPWVIGIQDPRRRDAMTATIPLASGALATSGDYERYFEKDGKRYCHILHPTTGLPVTYWRSVSVMAPLAVVAGGYCTTAMLLQERALAFLAQSGMDFLAMDANGQLFQKNQPGLP